MDSIHDHEMADSPREELTVPPPAQAMERSAEPTDPPQNAGLSMQSATSHSSDLADESALQHLNVSSAFLGSCLEYGLIVG